MYCTIKFNSSVTRHKGAWRDEFWSFVTGHADPWRICFPSRLVEIFGSGLLGVSLLSCDHFLLNILQIHKVSGFKNGDLDQIQPFNRKNAFFLFT